MRKNKQQKEVQEQSCSDIDEIYDVEKIVNKRTVRGRVEYLLKWKNYPE